MAETKKASGIKKLVLDVATSKSDALDPTVFKEIKEICRRDESAIGRAFDAILTQLSKPNAAIRLNCWRLVERLFDRSHAFRLRAVDRLEALTQLAVGTDPGKPLPPPKAAASRLQTDAIRAVKDWVERFGPGYPQLRVSYVVLQRTVDFTSLTLGRYNCFVF